MNNNMNHLTLISIFAFSLFTFSACSDDTKEVVPTVDIRDQMEGMYTYKNTDYNADGTTEEFLGTVVVQKGSGSNSIIILEDGDTLDVGINLTEVSNGISFGLEDYTETIDGQVWSSKGYEFIELDGVKYHGAYDFSTQELGFAFKVYLDGTWFYSSVYVLTKT
ncbi:MAG: hypothetical protein COA58_16805 [Bacteroidetes bacterium]|nr:MAG: hypothetical protein COA58_16805 [Bacteroidota bacterium]